MLPEILKKEEAAAKNRAPKLTTSTRASKRLPQIHTTDLEPHRRQYLSKQLRQNRQQAGDLA